MGTGHNVAVFGAYGHTGRFVVAELRDRGFVPLLAGRDADKLQALAAPARGSSIRLASVDDPASLDRALDGARRDQLRRALRHDRRPRDRGGAARRHPVRGRGGRDRGQPRHVHALRGPRPRGRHRGGAGDGLLRRPRRPAGHRRDGRLDGGRRGAHRLRAEQLAPHRRDPRRGRGLRRSGAAAGVSATPTGGWSTTTTTCRPWSGRSRRRLGTRSVIGEFTMADVVTIPSHLAIPRGAHLHDRRSGPRPGRRRTRRRRPRSTSAAAPRRPSSSTSSCAPAARNGAPGASGQDIYAVSAPLAVEAVHRILTGRTRTTGVASAGEMFDAPDFLRALSAHISVEAGHLTGLG